jgi:hypothetical protein
MLLCGLLVPAHLRAVDTGILQTAGQGTTGLVNEGLVLVGQDKLGPAQLLLQTAQAERLPGRERLEGALNELARQHPGWVVWGGPEPKFESIFEPEPKLRNPGLDPFTEYVVRMENRERVLGLLGVSKRPIVQTLLQMRSLTNTTIFPPSRSSSGQALDAAVSIGGLLVEGNHLTPGLSNAVFTFGMDAQRGNPQPLEELLLNLMSLGQRFNWGQLVAFISPIQDPETLRLQTHLVRRADQHLPTLFAAVHLSQQPKKVAAYVMNFSQTGLADLGYSLRFGAGGVKALIDRDQRVKKDSVGYRMAGAMPLGAYFCFAARLTWQFPGLALVLKWVLYLGAGFLIAVGMHLARPTVPQLELPLQVRGFHVAREVLFALGFLVAVLLISEPFLSQESQKVQFPFRLQLPVAGSAVTVGALNVKSAFMNEKSLLTLLLFFVLQALLYIACLVKLAEIRRQRVPARIKLKLLENEDHLFDAGLYLGFVGTIISLILVSLGIIAPSLMAAYSSTSFGILFVSFFKIFHLRPYRRNVLLEAEAAVPEPAAPATRPSFATPS